MKLKSLPTSNWQVFLGLLVGILLFGTAANAHECGPAHIYMTPQTTQVYQITADVAESEPTSYKLVRNSDPSVVDVSPTAPFASKVKGIFLIRSNTKLGDSDVNMRWDYAPNNAGANCIVHVHVVATEAEAEAGRIASANFDNSTYAGDPINTFTGDFYMDEKPDLSLGGPMPLYFQRSYNSGYGRNGFVTSNMGRNWTHNYDLFLYRFDDEIHIAHKRGKVLRFQLNVDAWDLVSPKNLPYQLIEDNGSYTLMDPTDQRRYSFDADGQLITVQDRNGNTHTLTITDNLPSQISDGLGRSLSLTYSGLHKMQSLSDGTRSVLFINYFEDLNSVRDARNLITYYNYPNYDGKIGSITRPAGNVALSRSFIGDRATQETDANGNETNISYNGLETTITDPLQDVRKHIYSAEGELVESVDPLNRSTTMGYNADEQRNSVTDRNGNVTSWTTHAPSGRTATITDAEGNTTEYTYIAQVQDGFTYYDLSEIQFADGGTVTFTRDTSGNPLTITNAANQVWTYTYNSRGQVLTETNPTSSVVTYTYDAAGNVATITSHFGDVTTYTYDDFSRVVRIDYPGEVSRSFTYDDNDNLLTFTDEGNQTWTHTYDDNNNLETTTDPLGETVTYTYDDMDRLSRIVDREGRQADYAYDERGRLQSIQNGAAETTSFGYDVNDRMIATTTNDGNTTYKSRDAEGLTTSLTDPVNSEWLLVNDKLGRLVQQTNPSGGQRHYEYDAMGRLLSTRNELGETMSRTYDDSGRLATIALHNGTQVAYGRNGLGLLDRITDPNGNDWLRGFDPTGRLTSETDPLGRAVGYTYDARSRLKTMTSNLGTLTFNYDDANRLDSRVYSDGNTISYTYDDNGRLTSANGLTLGYDKEANITASNGFIMTYDAANRLKTIEYASDKVVTYNYNDRGLVSEVIDWAGGSTTFGYDAVGNLTRITRPNQLETRLAYDADGALESRTVVNLAIEGEPILSSFELTRDLAGRIVAVVRELDPIRLTTSEETLFATDDAHQLVGNDYAYDALGRRLSDPDFSYTWDLASMLSTYTGPSGTATCIYDAYGMRTQRTIGGVTRGYRINYATGLPSVGTMTDGTSDLVHYIYLPNGMLLHAIDASDNTRHFYHFDEMGNTVYLSDAAANVTDSYSLTPFGRLFGQDGTTENPFLYSGLTGTLYDGDGLYYMRARYYDANSGRFLSRDPVKRLSPRALNPYQFADNNPKLYTDPSGKQVRISGYGRFGLDYNDGASGTGSRGVSETSITSRLRLQFDMSAETDGGVTFGARLRLEAQQNDQSGNTPSNGGRFYPSHDGFRVNTGGYTSGLSSTFGLYSGAASGKFASGGIQIFITGDFGSVTLGEGGSSGGASGTNYNSGGFTSTPRPDTGSTAHYSYSFGDWTVALGTSPATSDPGSHTGAAPQSGGSRLPTGSSYGIDFNHDLGGGFSGGGAGISGGTPTDIRSELGVRFQF